MREDTPEETSSTPVSSRSAHTWERPSGAHSRARSRARPVSSPERVSIRMVTVKNRIKAQMFSAEAREPVTDRVKAAENRAAWKWASGWRLGRGGSR